MTHNNGRGNGDGGQSLDRKDRIVNPLGRFSFVYFEFEVETYG